MPRNQIQIWNTNDTSKTTNLKIAHTQKRASGESARPPSGRKRDWEAAFGGYSSEEEGQNLPSWTHPALPEGQQQTAATRARTAALVAEIASGRAERIADCCLELITAAIQLRNAREYLQTAVELNERSAAYFSRGGIYVSYKDEWR